MITSPSRRRPFTRAVVAALVLMGAGWSLDGGAVEASPGARAQATQQDASGGGTFELLTYNVAGLPQGISGGNPVVNIPLISPLLEPYDVVLTQEDFDWWRPGGLIEEYQLDFMHYHDRLRAATTHAHATPRHPGPDAAGVDLDVRPDPEVGDGIGMLSRSPLAGFRTRAWHGCFGGADTSDGGAADCLAMKGFRVATMDLDGVPVDVYSLHAEAGSTATDQALQVDDFAELAAFIAEHSGDRAVIVGGDTNLHTNPSNPDTEIWQTFLAEVGLTDACAATACDQPGRIDKVAYRSSGAVQLEATAYDIPRQTFTDADGADLSDHLPVAVSFAWAPKDSYVDALFRTFLGRGATEAEVAYWGGLLAAGTSRATVATRLYRTPEGRRGPSITAVYPTYLDRTIDADARTYWADQLATGRPLDHVEIAVLASPESWTRAGATPAGFVDRLFRRTIGRGADAAGSAYFVGLLDAGASRSTVARLVHGSSEARRARATLVITALLGRAPTPAERDAAAERLRTTRDMRVVAADVVATDEFHDAST